MKTIIRTKLLGKHIEVREQQLGKHDLKIILCTSKNYKACFHVREDYMTLTLAQQKKGKVVNTQRSKFYPYDYYKIYTFLWKPIGKIETEQIVDKPIVFEGNTAYIG